jgi:hypothetical protein
VHLLYFFLFFALLFWNGTILISGQKADIMMMVAMSGTQKQLAFPGTHHIKVA